MSDYSDLVAHTWAALEQKRRVARSAESAAFIRTKVMLDDIYETYSAPQMSVRYGITVERGQNNLDVEIFVHDAPLVTLTCKSFCLVAQWREGDQQYDKADSALQEITSKAFEVWQKRRETPAAPKERRVVRPAGL
jgi:hypothetical protein